MEGLPINIKLPLGAPLFRTSTWSCEDSLLTRRVKCLKLAPMFIGKSTTLHELLLVHLGTIFWNGCQAFLHWFIGEGLDQVEFKKVENDMMILC